jgi:hypothetical protein
MLWLKLPAWAPGWVLETSPFVLPAARAAVAGHDPQGFARRVDDWGQDAVPGLRSCLRHHQVRVRRLAAEVLAVMATHGPLDASMTKALTVAIDDDDDAVARWAKRALHPPVPPPPAAPALSADPSAALSANRPAATARVGDLPKRRKARRKGLAPVATTSVATNPAATNPAAAAAKAADDDDEDDDDDDEDDMPGAPPVASPH